MILFIFNFFLTEIRMIEVPFSGAFTYFVDCEGIFAPLSHVKRAVPFLGKSHHGIYSRR